MKFILIVLLFIAAPFSGMAQLGGEDEVYLKAEYTDAKFMGGGMDKFNEFVNQELDYSKITKPGKIVFTFTVAETGEIKDIRVVEFPYIEMATEIIRVLKKAPHWEPAKLGVKPISIHVRFPMNFADKKAEVLSNPEAIRKNKNLVDATTETPPQFEGGVKGLAEFIKNNFREPNVPYNLKGKILTSFVVDVDGSIVDIIVLKDLGFGTKEEAIRVLKSFPKWKPATQNGTPIRVVYSLPISIDIRVD